MVTVNSEVAENDVHLLVKVLENFLEGALGFILFCRLIFPRPRSGGPVLIELSHVSLEVGAQVSRANWVVHVGNKTDVKEAGHSILERLHPADERLFLDDEVEEHFAETQKIILLCRLCNRCGSRTVIIYANPYPDHYIVKQKNLAKH